MGARSQDAGARRQERPTKAEIEMGTRSRTDRAAGAILAFEGLFLLAPAAGAVARALPGLGSGGKPGFMAFSDFVNGLVLAGVGLLTLFLAVWLWRRGPGARVFAATWVVVAGLYAWGMLWRGGNVLWAIWIMIVEPDTWGVRWPYFSWNVYLGRLDDVFFWLPGIVAVGALLVACLLLAGWITARAQGARSG
jgi:hypothetical protein